jgi:hypothetical protein
MMWIGSRQNVYRIKTKRIEKAEALRQELTEGSAAAIVLAHRKTNPTHLLPYFPKSSGYTVSSTNKNKRLSLV